MFTYTSESLRADVNANATKERALEEVKRTSPKATPRDVESRPISDALDGMRAGGPALRTTESGSLILDPQ